MDFFLSYLSEKWLLIGVLVALFMLYGIWPYNFFKKLGIPGPRPLPFIGTIREHRIGVNNFDQQSHEKYGKIWGLFDGRQPVMAILDPAIIKVILVKHFYTHFTNRRDFGLNGELDTSIAITRDEHWKRIRTVLSPNFTSGRLKEMLPIINHYGKMLEESVQKKVENEESIDLKNFFGGYSMDVTTSTSFSINVDSINNPNDPFVKHIKTFLKFDTFDPVILLVVIFPFLRPLFERLNFNMVAPSSFTNFFIDVLKKVKKDRQKNDHKNRVDFLQLMVDSQISGGVPEEANMYKALTDKEILTQAIVFIFAGYETTSTALSFLSYLLATNPDVQQKLQEEIDATLPNQATPTYDAFHQMEYLDMVVNETLRLYPVGGRVERECKDTVEINGVTIPKGTVIVIPTFALHRDPEYWPEPEEFRPERFSKENKETQNPYVYLPFGAGPRNCIGMRFALLVLKVAIVTLLQKYTFRPCKETQIPLEVCGEVLLKPKNPIKLKLVRRAGLQE
nr:cytochrome P450 3A9-like [Anolis sagrei ordinatus]